MSDGTFVSKSVPVNGSTVAGAAVDISDIPNPQFFLVGAHDATYTVEFSNDGTNFGTTADSLFTIDTPGVIRVTGQYAQCRAKASEWTSGTPTMTVSGIAHRQQY